MVERAGPKPPDAGPPDGGLPDAELPDVGLTGLGVARVRAAESERPDRLFDDPYARLFAAAAPDAFAGDRARARPGGSMSNLGAQLAHQIAVRTRAFDDSLLDACRAGCRQVVLLGSGLDTRAFRLEWPDATVLFELDLPEVLAFKDRVLGDAGVRARADRRAVGVDLRDDWPAALAVAGFDPQVPTAWLAEGLLVYLSYDDAAGILSRAGALSAPGSRLSLEFGDIFRSPIFEAARQTARVDRYTSLWKGGLGAEAPRWLSDQGWDVTTRPGHEVAAGYGRPVPERPDGGGFLVAVRR